MDRATRQDMERMAAIVPARPEQPLVDLLVADAPPEGVVVLRNREVSEDAPEGNVIARTSSVLVNLTADAFGTYDFFNRDMPAGTYGFAVEAKALSFPHDVRVGQVGATEVKTVQTDEWSRWELYVTLAGPGRLRLLAQHAGVPASMVFRRMQLYIDATVPAFDEHPGGHLSPLLRLPENRIIPGDDDAISSDGMEAFIPLPSYPAPTQFTEGVMIAAVSTEDDAQGAHPVLSTEGPTAGLFLAFAGGILVGGPAQDWSHGNEMMKLAGTGFHIVATRFRSGPGGEAAVFVDGIKVAGRNADDILPTSVPSLGVFRNPPNPGVPATQHPFLGRFAGASVFDKWMGDDKIVLLTQWFRQRMGVYRLPAIKPLNVLLGAGDSITEGGGGSGPTYVQLAFAGGLDGWIGCNMGASGKSVTTYPHWSDVEARCVSAQRNGHRPVVSIAFGANHEIHTVEQRDAALEEMRQRWRIFRRMGVPTIVHTTGPRDLPGWEEARLIFNDSIRALSSEYTALCDVGAHPVLGDASSLGGPLWLDHTHYSALAHPIYGAYFRSILEWLG